MPSGSGSVRCCRRRRDGGVARSGTIGGWSRGSSGGIGWGTPWRDVPRSFGPWRTLWKRHRRYSCDGTWDRIHAELLADAAAVGAVPGGSGPVSSVIRDVVRPDLPAALRTSIVTDATEVRRGVATQLDRLTAGIGALLLALTMLLIANSMIVSVMSRTAEIGLRRAMGASRRGIASLVLLEASIAGVVGGVSGSGVAAVIVVVTAAVNDWTARIDVAALGLAPVVGLCVACLASIYPALRAAAVQPATAVRSD